MSQHSQHLKAARIAMIVGIGGAAGFMILGAWASYVVRGNISWPMMLAVAFGAAFHFIGCLLFVNYFKSLAKNEDSSDE